MIIRVNAKLECASEGQTIGQRLNECKKCLFWYLQTECMGFIATDLVKNIVLIHFKILKDFCCDGWLFLV